MKTLEKEDVQKHLNDLNLSESIQALIHALINEVPFISSFGPVRTTNFI